MSETVITFCLLVAGAGAIASLVAAIIGWRIKRNDRSEHSQPFVVRSAMVVNGQEKEITIKVKGQPDLEGFDKLLEIAKNSAYAKYSEARRPVTTR